MRVLHVNESPPGGVVNYLREVSTEQVGRGHDVHLLASAPGTAAAGVREHHWSLARGNPFSYPVAVRQLVATVRRLQPDVIHLHSFWAGLFGRPPLARISDVPVVYQPHAWSVDLFAYPGFSRLVWALERQASRRTRVLVANCADEIEQGHRAGITNPSQVLGVPLDTGRFVPAPSDSRARCRQQLGLPANRMLLCLGRIGWQKGQDQLIAAWEAAPIPDTSLVFVGSGDTSILQALAPTQWGRSVHSFGNQQDVRPWIWACDLLLQPSRYETVGLAVAEAMSCGRPVVATRVNGIHEVIAAGPLGAAGAVVPLGAMDRMLAECARRLADPVLWAEDAQRARRRAEVQFSSAAVTDRVDLAYSVAVQTVGAQR